MTITTHPATDAYRSGWDETFGGTRAALDEMTRTGEDAGEHECPVLETMCAPDEPLPLVKVTEFVGKFVNFDSEYWDLPGEESKSKWPNEIVPDESIPGYGEADFVYRGGVPGRWRITVEFWPEDGAT